MCACRWLNAVQTTSKYDNSSFVTTRRYTYRTHSRDGEGTTAHTSLDIHALDGWKRVIFNLIEIPAKHTEKFRHNLLYPLHSTDGNGDLSDNYLYHTIDISTKKTSGFSFRISLGDGGGGGGTDCSPLKTALNISAKIYESNERSSPHTNKNSPTHTLQQNNAAIGYLILNTHTYKH